MELQIYNLQDLNDETLKSIARVNIDMMLDGQFCSICNGGFIGRNEKDNAILSGKYPLTYAHKFCWKPNPAPPPEEE